jgi:hypothetical protein
LGHSSDRLCAGCANSWHLPAQLVTHAVPTDFITADHQIGGFFGAWLGGLTISHFGDYSWMWYADMVLAAAAALACLPIREARLAPAPARAVPRGRLSRKKIRAVLE